MLDNTTRKRIDDCRDILVGKLPDPKSQIEQITIALIYKFMDDMDKEAIELGGTAKFFTDFEIPNPNDEDNPTKVEFKKYSWDNLFASKVTASELLKLYSESIESMEKNPNIPQLFREIFKNAYLPYRDSETLKLFLKTIGEFEYTHSEKLGDAFEYLLSVMGSQGDAGQFRTPRHIIDFLVEAVNPNKTDTIIDPACGTAGFLISAFKHIQGKNNGKLTPDERKKLIKNFIGYDISPDMVRLSLVNLYLHGFSDPHIYEYDTLTSEERWDENFDVVLANPPFMSPKGGIRPHKKFTVTSNRSEVLFVDYIAEHLNPNGRAGIIVPEGVIFQSGKAYKELRKMLVDDYLYAVVSLPAGVFNPYSGVKTSILFMDKAIAKRSNKVLFVKIDNDGYNLGAQRNEIKGGQLGEAIEILNNFKDSIENDTDFENIPLAHAVAKAKLAENGEYNFSGERYKPNDSLSTNYESVKLGEICRVINGKAYKQAELLDKGKYPVLRVGNFFSNRSWYYSDLELDENKYCSNGDLLYAWSASFGPKIWDGDKCIYHYHIWKMVPDETKINKHYLYHVLNRETESIKAEGGRGIAMIHITKGGIEKREIPLPPLSIQEEIVAEIEGYQKIIDGAKMVVENYTPQIDIDADWELVELSKICDINKESANPSDLYDDWFNYLDISTIENGTGKINYDNRIKVIDAPSRARRLVKQNDILLSTVRPNLKAFGYIAIEPIRFIASTGFAILTANASLVEPRFLYYSVFQEYLLNQMTSRMGKGSYPSINQKDVSELQIALPKLEIQKEIINQIEIEQKSIFYNEKLIEIYEQKIKNRIAKVWGK
jgi:type I restriction enzyme M protein